MVNSLKHNLQLNIKKSLLQNTWIGLLHVVIRYRQLQSFLLVGLVITILSYNIKCSFHNFYYRVGPLIRLWCMRFEAKNHCFKKLARSSKGFQNLCKTLAIHHQRLQSYWLSVEGGYLRSAQENGPGLFT